MNTSLRRTATPKARRQPRCACHVARKHAFTQALRVRFHWQTTKVRKRTTPVEEASKWSPQRRRQHDNLYRRGASPYSTGLRFGLALAAGRLGRPFAARRRPHPPVRGGRHYQGRIRGRWPTGSAHPPHQGPRAQLCASRRLQRAPSHPGGYPHHRGTADGTPRTGSHSSISPTTPTPRNDSGTGDPSGRGSSTAPRHDDDATQQRPAPPEEFQGRRRKVCDGPPLGADQQGWPLQRGTQSPQHPALKTHHTSRQQAWRRHRSSRRALE